MSLSRTFKHLGSFQGDPSPWKRKNVWLQDFQFKDLWERCWTDMLFSVLGTTATLPMPLKWLMLMHHGHWGHYAWRGRGYGPKWTEADKGEIDVYCTGFPLFYWQKNPGLFQDPMTNFPGPFRSRRMFTYKEKTAFTYNIQNVVHCRKFSNEHEAKCYLSKQ